MACARTPAPPLKSHVTLSNYLTALCLGFFICDGAKNDSFLADMQKVLIYVQLAMQLWVQSQ